MSDQTIKSFLVGLGFKVDEAGRSRFEQTLTGIGMQALKLEAAVAAAGASVGAFAVRVASHMDQLYFASQRTGATVQGLQAIGYAASQTGSSAQAAQGAVENLAHFMRTNPGAEGWIDRLGVSTRDAHGNMRDTADIFMDLGSRLSQMPYYQANQFAQQFGLDERTLIAMTRNMRQARDQYNGFARDIGYNGQQAAQESHGFMSALRELYAVTGLLSDKIGSDTAGSLTGSVNSLSQVLLQNAPVIEQWADRGIRIIGKVSTAIQQNGGEYASIGRSIIQLSSDLDALLKVAGRLSGMDLGHGLFADGLNVLHRELELVSNSLSSVVSFFNDIRHGNFSNLGSDVRNLAMNIWHDWPGFAVAREGYRGAGQFLEGTQNALFSYGAMTSSAENQANYHGLRGEELIRSQAPLFQRLERLNHLPSGLLASVAYQESRGNPFAISNAGAMGEFQFMPSTARQYGLTSDQMNDPTVTATAAARMLSGLLRQYHGNLTRALQAYNLGSGNLNSRLANHRPLPLETQRYAPQIIARMPQSTTTNVHVTVHGDANGRVIGDQVADAVEGVNARNAQVAGFRSQ